MRRWSVPGAVDAPVSADAVGCTTVTVVTQSLRSGLHSLGVTGAEVVALAVRSSGRQRSATSRAGRVAVAGALHGLGAPGMPGRDVHGRPVWPAGVTGAVSHGAGLAVAVCVRADRSTGDPTLGVDLERATAVGDRVARRVAVDGDVGPTVVASDVARAVCFSAKESAYKALSFAAAPALVGTSFAGMGVRCLDDGTFGAAAPDGRSVVGRWWVVGQVVVTVAVHTPGR